ncbi:MAG: hypothetical protein D3926_07720 [Desulfobacteraceae bacterium]|nr:MAG: hypothetical protein D3926_07720 [Desulfobacteraceae bacterium]
MLKSHTSTLMIILSVITMFLFPAMGFASPRLVLKMNHQFPPDTPGSKIDQWFARQIQRRTGGQIQIRIFWSNGLGEPKENLGLLRRGAIDMAGMSAGYFPEQMPLLAAPNSIPMALDNVCQSSRLMKDFLTQVPEISMEAEALGIRPLFFHVLNPYLLVTKEPVTRLSQLKGKRIRTWGHDMADLVRAAGAKPVPLFLPDLYRAMETGVIDGCPFSVDLVIVYRIDELAKHISDIVMWEGPSWGVWVSSALWGRLLPAEQEVFLQAAEEARQESITGSIKAEAAAREALLEKGVTFHPFPDKALEEWKEKSPDFFNEFINRMEQIGKGGAARKMVSLWRKIKQNSSCP